LKTVGRLAFANQINQARSKHTKKSAMFTNSPSNLLASLNLLELQTTAPTKSSARLDLQQIQGGQQMIS